MPAMSEVQGYIIANSTRFVSGGSTGGIPLWMNKLPATSADTAVVLLESGGPGPTYTYTGISYERPALQMISRSTSYVTARDNSQHVWELLASVTGITISKTSSTGVTNYLTITPIQSPTDMGQDVEERSLVTCNFLIEKELS